jgi:CRP-like cAMP-binding protein/hydrogenase maturation factor
MILSQHGKIVEESTDGMNRIGIVEFDGKRRPVYLSLVPGSRVGDYVKFQAGFATESAAAPDNGAAAGEASGFQPDLLDIQAYGLLRDLDPQQLRKLLPLAQEEYFAAGDTIFGSGEQSLFLHLIVSGEVGLYDDSLKPRVKVQTLTSGDAAGWSALTLEAETHFQARALTAVSTLAFDGAQMRAACERDPVMGFALMKGLLEMVTERLDAVRAKLFQTTATAG